MRNYYQEVVKKVGTDKVAHFAVSAFLCLAIGRFLPFWASAVITLALGIGKEVYDAKTGGKVDKKDILADALGVLVAVALLLI